jgi:hypothetical protein
MSPPGTRRTDGAVFSNQLSVFSGRWSVPISFASSGMSLGWQLHCHPLISFPSSSLGACWRAFRKLERRNEVGSSYYLLPWLRQITGTTIATVITTVSTDKNVDTVVQTGTIRLRWPLASRHKRTRHWWRVPCKSRGQFCGKYGYTRFSLGVGLRQL